MLNKSTPVISRKRITEKFHSQSKRFLLHRRKEGEIILPEENVLWWNPYTKRVYKRTIQERRINIAANPDLDLMKSLKDSLQAMATPVNTGTSEEETFPWIRIIVILISLFILYETVKLSISFSKKIKAKQAVYKQSEVFYFKELLRILNNQTTNLFIRDLYVWFDKARNPLQSPVIKDYLLPGEETLFKEIVWTNYAEENSKISTKEIYELTTILKNARARIINRGNQKLDNKKLNPV